MRFLVDCCAAGRRLAKWLWNEGHDVFDAGELEHDPGDVTLLARAAANDRGPDNARQRFRRAAGCRGRRIIRL